MNIQIKNPINELQTDSEVAKQNKGMADASGYVIAKR